MTTILYIVSIVSFCVGIFVIPDNDYDKLKIFGIVFAVTFIIAIILSIVVKNLASHWIQDRLNEKLWMDENALYHFQQVAFAAGLNSRNADSTGYHYSDAKKQIIDREWPLNGYEAIFYDYFEPSLIDILKSKGINVEVRELNSYSVFNNTI